MLLTDKLWKGWWRSFFAILRSSHQAGSHHGESGAQRIGEQGFEFWQCLPLTVFQRLSKSPVAEIKMLLCVRAKLVAYGWMNHMLVGPGELHLYSPYIPILPLQSPLPRFWLLSQLGRGCSRSMWQKTGPRNRSEVSLCRGRLWAAWIAVVLSGEANGLEEAILVRIHSHPPQHFRLSGHIPADTFTVHSPSCLAFPVT